MRALTPVAIGESGASVAALHEALDLLGVGPIPEHERTTQRYGEGTHDAVARLQERHGWSDLTVGQFDEPCAARTNLVLSELGRLEIADGDQAVAPVLWDRFQVAAKPSAADTSDVAALSRFPANMEVWWFKPDKSVQGGFFYDDGQNWRQPYPVPGPDASPTSGIAALSRKDDTMEVWWIAGDRLVRGAFWYDDRRGWQPYPDPVESVFTASPDSGIAAMSRTPHNMEIWWVGSDGHMRGAFWVDDGLPWRPYPLPSPVKASLSSGLAAVSRFPENMEVWWVGEHGSVEGAFWYEGDTWQPYGKQVAPDGSAAAHSHNLTGVARTRTSMDLLWITPEGAVQWAYWNDGSQWQLHPQKVAEDGSASPDSGIAAISRTASTMEVFWIAPDGSVQNAAWEYGGDWKRQDPVADKNNASPKSGIAAISRTAVTTEVFWVAPGGAVSGAVRNDANRPFSFRMLRPHDLLDLRCDAVGCRIVTGAGVPPTIQYKVASGDTLWSIAERYYGDGSLYTLIAAANHLADPDLIRAGDVLVIPPRPVPAPPPKTYVVAAGDTLWDIANRVYRDPNKYRLIAQANHLADPGLIVPGQELLIPQPSTADAQSRLRAVTDDAHIVVHFGVQNLYEQRYPDGSTPSGVAAARAANDSRVVFQLPKRTEMPFTVSGVLEGLTKLGLRVSPWAVPRVTTEDPRPDDARAKPTAPKDDETAIEAPYRLVVSPDGKYGGFTHSAKAAAAPHDPSRVELWHTRLAVRVFDSHGKFLRIDEGNDERRTVRAVWTRDNEQPTPGFLGSLSDYDRKAIVRQTADPSANVAGGPLIEPEPLTVERFYLSSLGAWIDWRAVWVATRYDPTGIEAYRHLATVGRDHYVRIEDPIYLYPFGHRAVLVSLTERKIDFEKNPAAYLYFRQFIVLRERTRDYGDVRVTVWPYNSAPFEHDAVNQLPFTSVSIDPVVSPDLDPLPHPLPGPVVPTVTAGTVTKQYRWKVTGVDHAGRQISMDTPLVAVPRGGTAYQHAFDTWWNEVASKDAIALGGVEVAFATPAKAGDTTARAQFMELHGVDPGRETCTPWMSRAHITIPALATLNRAGGPTPVGYRQTYVQQGFTVGEIATDKSELFLLLNDQSVTLDFAARSDRGGGFVEPSIPVKALSRAHGAVGDAGGGTDGIESGKFDPTQFLTGASPKLFGLLDLIDIVTKGDTLDIAPKLVAEQFGFIRAAKEEYDALVHALQRTSDILKADRDNRTAPEGAKERFGQLYGQAVAALSVLPNGGVDPLIKALNEAPSSAGVPARRITEAVKKVKDLLDNQYLAPFLRALVERPYHALSAILITADSSKLDEALRLPVDNTTIRYDWFPTITGFPAAAPVFVPNDASQGLAIAVEVRTAADGKPQSDVSAQLRDFELHLPPGEEPLMLVKFCRIGFCVTTGGKPEVDVQFNGLEFGGVLSFIETLRRLIPFDGFSDPPFVDVKPDSATAGFHLALPSVAIGVFSLENIALGADCRVPFLGEAVTVGFYFCTKEAPFRLTVLAIGGGGWLGIRLGPTGLVLLEMGLEAGASMSVDLVVASGSVSVMIGVYMRLEDEKGQLTGYFRIRGEVEVLGFASASITLELSLTYYPKLDKLTGRASLRVEIEVAFFSASVEVTCERTLAGSRGDPSLCDMYDPNDNGQALWEKYYESFAIKPGA
jgi:nucleoid-associated protein YgaU